MRTQRVLVALLSAVGIAGCDPIHGVSRDAYVTVMPAPAPVLAVIRSAPGVDSVDYIRYDGRGTPEDSNVVISFDYRGRGDVRGILQFIRGPGSPARVQYTQHVTSMGSAPAQREVDATYPVMLAIEARLEALPGLAGLRRAVVQRCDGVRCP